MTLLSESKSRPQTCSAIIGRVSTRPALRKKYSRSAYSRVVSSMRRPPRVTAPEQRADARQELLERERLRHVVVGAAVEAGHLVRHAVPRRQHEHRRDDAAVAEAGEDAEAVALGQHEVEHDEVVRGTGKDQ